MAEVADTTSGLRALDSMAMPSQVDVRIGPAISTSVRVLLFDQSVPESQAEAAAAIVAARPDVVWAEPDRPVRIADARATPVLPNDPLFGQQWDLWDSARAQGGYSVRAPVAWESTTGSADVVVAIIDTGFTSHPDLNANVVPGYDFVSDVPTANDGNGRDPDPADPGDWITSSEAASGIYGSGCAVSDSSWHGTHVAGTVAAVRDNGIGIAGIAPGVRIQSARGLGKCGGYDSDITAAITWAVGGSVPGVPANPTPAKVVNLSLGGSGSCTRAYTDAIAVARSRGAVVVVAAGNEGSPVSDSVPANCPGVVSVAATSRTGQLAGYSNYGTSAGDITLSAPGGDYGVDVGILSTLNAGRFSPGTPTYDTYQGTSMATPHVAAGAALVYSLGVTGTADVTAALVEAVQSFPQGGAAACSTVLCGAGILDLSALAPTPPVTAPGPPTNVATVAGDASVEVTWSAPVDTGGAPLTTYTATAAPGGETCTTSSTGCTIGDLSNGTTYDISVTASNEAGLTSSPSAPVTATPQSLLPGAVVDLKVRYRGTYGVRTAIFTWSQPVSIGASEISGYRARLARAGGTYSSWTTFATTTARANGLRVGVKYRVQVQAGNDSGYGPSSTLAFIPR